MAVGDSHTAGPDGWPLCGASGPLRGYYATSPNCSDCAQAEHRSQWTVEKPYTPNTNAHLTAHAQMRKRPVRLLP